MIAAIVLAAGLSRRMGSGKLLAVIEGKPLVRWAVEGIVSLVDDVVVVTQPEDAPIREALAGLAVRFATNPRPEDGQGTSIATGAAALAPETDAALVVLGDQPWLPAAAIPALLAEFRATHRAIVAPVYRGTQGNPVLFAAATFGELRALDGDAGARRIVDRDPARVTRVFIDGEMPADVDTADDLARLTATRRPRVQ